MAILMTAKGLRYRSMKKADVESLRNWFLMSQRDLPWRGNASPYAVWVSEVMLQQTQVAVVIPYFERWMQQFPTIAHLAEASLDEVIKAWEGLGYYSRARHLYAGAKQVLAEFGGHLPYEEHLLSKIKGLGPYTVGAIRAFAFRQKAAAVDGNVLRVMSRYDCIEDEITKTKTVQAIRRRVEQVLPDKDPWVISEALIELGATLCGRKPNCLVCPLKNGCTAFAKGVADSLPKKSVKTVITKLYRAVPVLICQDYLLVRRGQEGEIMNDLHEFPWIETCEKGYSLEQLCAHLKNQWQIEPNSGHPLESVRYNFTRYDVKLFPYLLNCSHRIDISGYQWKSFKEVESLAFSSGHRRIYQQLLYLL
jgi:A/G-specific adenine glycosylase